MKLIWPLTRRLNITGLIGSCIAASILWLYVQLSASYEYRMDIPLRADNIREGKILKRPVPPTIKVQIQGPGLLIMALRLLWSSDMYFAMDLSTINEYWKCPANSYMHWINVPPEVEQITIQHIVSPDTIYIELDDKGERKVPVVSDNIAISPESGYMRHGPVVFKPESVLVAGPQSILRDIKAVQTARLSLIRGAGTHSQPVLLEKHPNPQISYSPEEVTAVFALERIGERSFDGIPVAAVGLPPRVRVRIEPETVRVVMRAGEDFLKKLDPAKISATIQYRNTWRRNASYQLPVQITSPGNLVYCEAIPGVLTVSIE